MIQFVTGNFFDYKADIRINTVNCVGAMGAGVALQFKNKYPEMNKEYVKACNDGTLQIGKPHVWTNNDFFNEDDNVIIINFPTKLHWKNPSEYEYIEKGLQWLSNFLINHKGKTITVPALGCGHGGLDWAIVKEMIIKYLSKLEMNILIFEPESSVKKNDTEIERKLVENQIIRLSAVNNNYPFKLKGKSGSNIYLKGNIKQLNDTLVSLFVNSNPDEKEKKVVYDCLNTFEKSKFTFLLGYNSSFEIDIVKYLLEHKFHMIIALPFSILNLKIRKDLQQLWDENLITLISIADPDSSWNISDSIKMLKFRFKYSDILLFTYHELNSIIKYEKELQEINNNKFYINYWNEPISFYTAINAKKIGKNRDTNKPNLAPLLNIGISVEDTKNRSL